MKPNGLKDKNRLIKTEKGIRKIKRKVLIDL
jgi:hypothetical protein